MDIEIRHQPLDLFTHYTPERFPSYDTYDAIECGRYSEIPMDTDKIIGVPITYLAYHCNEQFEIIGEFKHGCDSEFDLAVPIVNGKSKYTRIAIPWIREIRAEKTALSIVPQELRLFLMFHPMGEKSKTRNLLQHKAFSHF